MIRKRLLPLGLTFAAVALVALCLYYRDTEVKVLLSASGRQYKLGDEMLLDVIISGKTGSERMYRDSWYDRIPFIARRLWRESSSCDLELTAKRKDGRQCVDPRAYLPPSGLVGAFEPNESGTATVALNRFTVISEPGTFEVVAELKVIDWEATPITESRYYSEPIDIVVRPRTDREASEHIEQLIFDFQAAASYSSMEKAIERLIYTRDRRIVPALIEWAYLEDSTNLASRGFSYFRLDCQSEILELVLAAARERGLVDGTLYALQRFGCPESEFKDLIGISLESDNPRIVQAGVGAAAKYPDDSHTDRLIELAESAKEYVRNPAIMAIVNNRTDEGVAFLKKMVAQGSSPTPILLGYLPFQWRGRTWDREYENVDDFPRRARDPKNHARWEAMRMLVELLSPEELARVKALAAGNSKEVKIETPSDGLSVIEELLSDSDSDVRDFVVTCIRFASSGCPGRPLKPEDFPDIYAEYKKERDSEDYD